MDSWTFSWLLEEIHVFHLLSIPERFLNSWKSYWAHKKDQRWICPEFLNKFLKIVLSSWKGSWVFKKVQNSWKGSRKVPVLLRRFLKSSYVFFNGLEYMKTFLGLLISLLVSWKVSWLPENGSCLPSVVCSWNVPEFMKKKELMKSSQGSSKGSCRGNTLHCQITSHESSIWCPLHE